MVYGELQRQHYLFFDQEASDNAYSAPFHHEVWNMDRKMEILGIDLCYNTFSHIGVQHQHYPGDDTVCMYIFFR